MPRMWKGFCSRTFTANGLNVLFYFLFNVQEFVPKNNLQILSRFVLKTFTNLLINVYTNIETVILFVCQLAYPEL